MNKDDLLKAYKSVSDLYQASQEEAANLIVQLDALNEAIHPDLSLKNRYDINAMIKTKVAEYRNTKDIEANLKDAWVGLQTALAYVKTDLTPTKVQKLYNTKQVIEFCSDAINSCTSGTSSHNQDFSEWCEETLGEKS